ncbi:MAG: right-handed parallel beta-helix repeat-containing protein [Planctomycetota bacterium]
MMRFRSLLLFSLLAAPLRAGSVLYVDAAAGPGGDGQQWTSAFTDLQAALDLARLTGGVSEIRVAQGLYLPDGGTGDASLAFELVSGVRHIGGFATGGGAWNPEQFVTVLSGDLLGNDGPPGPGGYIVQWQENSNHVVHGTAPAAGTTFEGFRVVGGNADSGLTSGGGLAVEGGELLVRHCEFVRNRGAAGGGGMALIDCTASVERCTFVENRGDQQGGGALVAGPAATVWRECRFEANTGGQGSGLSVGPSTFFASDSSEPLIEDCDFIGNIGQVGATGGGGLHLNRTLAAYVRDCRFIANSSNGGGGLYLRGAMAQVDRCHFERNEVNGDGGGAIYFDNFDGLVTWVPLVRNCVMIGNTGALACIDMSAELVHCTVADNLLPGAGPGLSWPAMFVWNGQILLRQSIVWGHLPQGNNGDERDHLLAFGTGGYGIENCIIEAWQGVLPGTATGSDPQFVDPLGPDGDRFEFADNRYELAATSPGLDAGDIGALGSGILTDAYGRDRYRDGNADTIDQADLGGLERMRPTDFGTSDCGGQPRNQSGRNAWISATGSTSIAANDLRLWGDNLPPGQFALVLSSRGEAEVAHPGGSLGTLCLGGGWPIGRHNRPGEILLAGGPGIVWLDIDWTDLPGPTGPQVALPGETWRFQLWHRDFIAGVGSVSNFSQALSLTAQ